MAEATMNHVSVIIPAWRAAGTIERALRSVAAQSVRPREAVVVDDGSDDGTFEAAKACRPFMGDIGLIVVRQANAGAGAARNRAIRESRGDILAFLDADDEWLPTHLERSLAVMEEGEYVLTAHNSVSVASDGTETLNDCAARFREGPDPYVTLYRKGYIDTCTVLAKRDAVLAVGGFDEMLPNAQDFELWLKLLRAPSTPFAVFEDVLCRYHLVAGSIMTYTERRRRCTIAIAHAYAPDLKNLLYRVLAIHYEAFNVHRAQGAPMQMILEAARLGWALPEATVRYGVARLGPVRTRRWGAAMLWGWTVLALGLYLSNYAPWGAAILRRVEQILGLA